MGEKNKDYSNEAAAFGVVGGTAAQTAAAMPVFIPSMMKQRKFYKTNTEHVSKRVFGEDVLFNHPRMKSYGGAGFDPGEKKLYSFSSNPNKMTKLEEGVLAHEIGHKKNFANMSEGVVSAYAGVRSLAPMASIVSPIAIAAARDKKEAGNIALAANAPSAIVASEEALASARGIKHIAGHMGWKSALKRAPHSLVGLSSYAAMGLPAFIAYKLKAKQLDKHASVFVEAIHDELEKMANR